MTERKLCPCLMVVGTASDVGKSLLVTGLCHYFAQAGLKVAPFKAQNMSLNAAVTPDGFEIGRAQWVQAEAAGAIPHVDMNPILLKPEGQMRSQVVVMGKPWATLAPADYYERHTALSDVVAQALMRLRSRYDLVVLEGAGSPAELNLAERDLVNMAAARMAEAAVILVADIERGGVFASILGTLDLLKPEDRARVKGLVVNKFRGDPRLFDTGVSILEQRSGLPVLGVLPHLGELAIADEDSMAIARRRQRTQKERCLDLCVIRLPYISNFEDVLPLEHEPDVTVRFVSELKELGEPDLLILPGSKSTRGDLAELRSRGFAEALLARARTGRPILGVCGGFQMLGLTIHDPNGVEGQAGSTSGLGLLGATTHFEREKTTASVRAKSLGSSWFDDTNELSAYEIHHGSVRRDPGVRPLFRLSERNGQACELLEGAQSPNGQVLGTLLHGFLAHDELRAQLLSALWRYRGQERRALPYRFAPQTAYAALSQALAQHLDLARVRSWLCEP